MTKEPSNNEIQLLDALLVVARYKSMVIKLVVSITLLSLGVSLVWPQTFRSSAVVLPPARPAGLQGITGVLGGMLPMNLGSEPQINSETILTILGSRDLRVEMINHFNLQEVYSSTITEELLMKLGEHIRIEDSREGGFGFNPITSIRISVTDSEPERARDMTAFLVRRLDDIIRDINRDNVLEHLAILEERYEQNLADLDRAEEALKTFQQTHGIVEVEEQARVTVQNLAQLKARITETEVAVQVLAQTVAPDNSELRQLRRTRDELQRQFDLLMQQSDREARQASVTPALLDLPALGLEYYRLFREVTVQNAIYETIYPQYDIQQLYAQTSRRGIQVLDEPHLPTYKDAPKRAFIVLGGLVFSVFLSLLLVFIRHTLDHGRQHNTALYHKLVELGEHLRWRKGNKAAE